MRSLFAKPLWSSVRKRKTLASAGFGVVRVESRVGVSPIVR